MENNKNLHEETKLWNKNYIIILVLSIILNSAAQMVTPLVSKYAVESLGAPLSIAASIGSVMSFAALFLRPVSGLFSDRYNRKIIIMIANVVIALCMFLMTLVRSVPALVAVRLVHGIAFSFNGVALMAFNAVYIPKDRLGEGMGYVSLSNIVSQAIGPNVGVKLVEIGGYGLCFAVAAGICLGGVVLVGLMRYESPKADTGKKLTLDSLISMRLLPYAAILGLFSVGNGLVTNLLVLFGDERGIANVAMFFTCYSIAMVLIRPVSGKLVDKKGLKFILPPSIVLAAIAFATLGFARSLPVVLLASVLKAIGQGSGAPAIQSTAIRQIGKERAGVASSTCFIGQDIGNTLAPIVGGFVAEGYGYTAMFESYAILLLVGGLTIFYLKWNYDVKKYGDRA